MQAFHVRSESKNLSGKIALVSAAAFLLVLAAGSVLAALNPQPERDNRWAIQLPLSPHAAAILHKEPAETTQVVPSRYTHEVRIDSACDLKLAGVTPQKQGATCWLAIDRHVWTDGLVTGEPARIKRPEFPGSDMFELGLDEAATLFLYNPKISPRYPLSASVLGNHVVHYTPRGTEWIDFE